MKPDFNNISIFTAIADQNAKAPITIDQSVGVAPFTRSTKATGNILTSWKSILPAEMEQRIEVKMGESSSVFDAAHAASENTVFVLTLGENFIENIAYLRAFRTAFAIRFDKAPVLAVSVENETDFRAMFKLMAAILGEATILLTSDALMERYLEDEAQLQNTIDALGGAHILETTTEKYIQLLLA